MIRGIGTIVQNKGGIQDMANGLNTIINDRPLMDLIGGGFSAPTGGIPHITPQDQFKSLMNPPRAATPATTTVQPTVPQANMTNQPNQLNALLGGLIGGNSQAGDQANMLLRLFAPNAFAPQVQEGLGAGRETIQNAIADPRATAQNVLAALMELLPVQAQEGINTAIGNVRERLPQAREGMQNAAGNIFDRLPQMQNLDFIRSLFSGQFGGNAGSFNDILSRLLGRNRNASNG